MKKTIKKTREFMERKVNKLLRWLRFHKPENFCRSSYVSNKDRYWIWLEDDVVDRDKFYSDYAKRY